MKREGKDVQVGKCIRDIDERFGVKATDKKRIWKQRMKKIINKKKMIGTKQPMLM